MHYLLLCGWPTALGSLYSLAIHDPEITEPPSVPTRQPKDTIGSSKHADEDIA